MMDEVERISITVCGDGGTGKSSISLRLVRSKWTHEYDPTVQDSYSVTRVVDGRTYQLSLTDTAGQEEYRGLWAAQNLAADAYLLVYDITNSDSLVALDYFNDLVEMDSEERGPGPKHVKIVAGNKCDLANGRQVSSAEGLRWARDHDCGFMETSAKNIVNIEETFALLVRRVVAAREAAANGDLQPQLSQQQQQSQSQQQQQRRNRNDSVGDNMTKPLTPLGYRVDEKKEKRKCWRRSRMTWCCWKDKDGGGDDGTKMKKLSCGSAIC